MGRLINGMKRVTLYIIAAWVFQGFSFWDSIQCTVLVQPEVIVHMKSFDDLLCMFFFSWCEASNIHYPGQC